MVQAVSVSSVTNGTRIETGQRKDLGSILGRNISFCSTRITECSYRCSRHNACSVRTDT